MMTQGFETGSLNAAFNRKREVKTETGFSNRVMNLIVN